MIVRTPNLADAPNPAMKPGLQSVRHERRIGDLPRSAYVGGMPLRVTDAFLPLRTSRPLREANGDSHAKDAEVAKRASSALSGREIGSALTVPSVVTFFSPRISWIPRMGDSGSRIIGDQNADDATANAGWPP